MTRYRLREPGWWRRTHPAALDGCGAGPGEFAPRSQFAVIPRLVTALVIEAAGCACRAAVCGPRARCQASLDPLASTRPSVTSAHRACCLGSGRRLWPGPRRGLAGRPVRPQARRARAGSSACRCGYGSLSSPRQSRCPGPLRTGATAAFGTGSASDGMTRRRVGRHPKVDLTGGIFCGAAQAPRCHRA